MSNNNLTGVYLDMYEYALRTNKNRKIQQTDEQLAERYPKLTILALSDRFDVKMLYEIIYAKQLQELGEETNSETFERTSKIGKQLAERYIYEKNPDLRPNEETYTNAQERLRNFNDERLTKK